MNLTPSAEAQLATTARCHPLLGGSWVVISGVIRRVTIVITHIRGLITLLITTLNL